MFLRKFVLSAFWVVATTSCVAPIDVDTTSKPTRKLAKKTKQGGGGSTSIVATNIEGTYIYSNKCRMVFQLAIQCGGFPADPELCEIAEFWIGSLTEETDPDGVALDNGSYYTPTLVEGKAIDPDKTCLFSGVFRKSSAMGRSGNSLKAVPLATSNGCSATTTNFQTVVKAEVQAADGSLEISLSNDKGGSWYTNNKASPKLYIAHKVDDETLNRALLAIPDGESVVDTRLHHLVAIPHLAIPTGATFKLDHPSRALGIFTRLTIDNQTPFYAKAYVVYDGCSSDYWGWNAGDDQPAVPPGQSAQHGAWRGFACYINRVYANLKDVPPDYELDGHIIPADVLNHNNEVECETLVTKCDWAGDSVRIEIKPEGYTDRLGKRRYCRVVDPEKNRSYDVCSEYCGDYHRYNKYGN